MKKIGMIGGFGPESTLDYYRLMIKMFRENIDSKSCPEIIINSMDINKLMNMMEKKRWEEIVYWLAEGVKTLYKAGADFGFISANTPHVVFEEVQDLSPIPLISIVQETCKKVIELDFNKVGLLGTGFTMNSTFYQAVFDKNNIQIVLPNDIEKRYIHNKLMDEIELGIFLEETRNGLLKIIQRMIYDHGIKAVILGCTELPLILTKDEFGIPFINTTKVHVESVLKYYLE